MVLDCELSKDVNVVWYHDEAEIKASMTVAIKAEEKRRTLVIKRVGDKDKGQYVCDCGTDKTTAVLHIEGKDSVLDLCFSTLFPLAPSRHFITHFVVALEAPFCTCHYLRLCPHLSSLRPSESGRKTLQV